MVEAGEVEGLAERVRDRDLADHRVGVLRPRAAVLLVARERGEEEGRHPAFAVDDRPRADDVAALFDLRLHQGARLGVGLRRGVVRHRAAAAHLVLVDDALAGPLERVELVDDIALDSAEVGMAVGDREEAVAADQHRELAATAVAAAHLGEVDFAGQRVELVAGGDL